MFELRTKRLRLLPLNIDQLELLMNNKLELEKSLGLLSSNDYKFNEAMEKDLEGAWKFWVEGVKRNPFNYTWFTRWEIIFVKENKFIGTCGFKGMPNYAGEVEVGYMIDPKYQNNGLMSEALAELVKYAFMHQRVRYILAETPKENISSQKVLIKNGFKNFKETDDNFWWKADRNNLKEIV